MEQNRQIYNFTYDQLFHRMYGNGGMLLQPLKNNSPANPEILFMANLWLPEALSYMTLRFDDLWGTHDGNLIRSWARTVGRPIIWVVDSIDKTKFILDPTMNCYVSPIITTEMVDYFNELWITPNLTFEQLHLKVSKALHFKLPSYYASRKVCRFLTDIHPENGNNQSHNPQLDFEIIGSNSEIIGHHYRPTQPQVANVLMMDHVC